MRPYKDVKKRFLADPEFRREYEVLKPGFELIESIVRRRKELEMTQKELADKLGTGQAVISRLEGANISPTLASLVKIAEALDSDLHIELKPKSNSKAATLARET